MYNHCIMNWTIIFNKNINYNDDDISCNHTNEVIYNLKNNNNK